MSHLRVDAHQHFWIYHPDSHAWISDDMKVLKRDFLPADLQPVLLQAGLHACIAVQAAQTEEENAFLLSLAEKARFVKGIVGWVDLRSEGIEERLHHYSRFPLVKGFRHVLQDEPNPRFMLEPVFAEALLPSKNLALPTTFLFFIITCPSPQNSLRCFPNSRS